MNNKIIKNDPLIKKIIENRKNIKPRLYKIKKYKHILFYILVYLVKKIVYTGGEHNFNTSDLASLISLFTTSRFLNASYSAFIISESGSGVVGS